MSNDNYMEMTNEELVTIVKNLNINNICLNRQLKKPLQFIVFRNIKKVIVSG